MMRRKSRRGGNALEFALVMPVIVGLMFATFEFSFAFNRYMIVTAAARDAVRQAAMARSDEDPAEIARAVALAYLDMEETPEELTVETQVLGTAPTRTVRVLVARSYQPLVGGLIPTPERIGAVFTMRMEDQL